MTLKRNGASIIPLIQPSRQELHDKLWNQDWDILFFAGHSSSQMANHGGQLQISDGRTITLDDLENDLRKAVERGLKLAIFNSCDGLAIADYLARLGVPNMIVMKEPVPDEIARYFLQYFLEEFSTGKPFYLAVREARHRLQWIERDRENPYPCATWLPIICQNPTEPELVWPSQRPTRNSFWRKAALVGAGLTALAGVVVGGWLVRENIKPPSSSQLDESSISSSLGGRKMIRVNPDKQNGLIAFDNKDFSAAIQHFEASLRKEPNDPEALIFLNNAIAAQQDKLGLKSVLRIAVSVPIGKTPSGSEELLRGVAQAQSEWNCSEIRRVKAAISRSQSLATCIGVNDKLIQVKIYDDKDDPQIAERVARELIQDPSILGAIGHFSSDVTLKAGKIYEDGKLVVISPASTSVSLSNFSDYVFRTPSNDEVAAKNLVNYIRKLGYTKAAVAFDTGNDYSRSLTRMFQDQFVEKGEQTINLPECDLSNPGVGGDSCVSKARQQGAQVLLLTPGNRTTIDVALRVVSANRGKLRLLGGDAMYVPKTLKEFGPQSVDGNLVLSVPWHRSSRPSASERAFIDDFQMLWGTGAVNWRSAAAYEATQAIAEGLHRLGKNPDRSLLRQELLSPDFSAEGVVGLVQFEPSGDRKSTSGVGVLVQVQKVGRDEGGDKYDFVRVK
ncbi:MAG: ABC transporter substrate-binding protein [Leptolyngbyaceae cyanobacterium bins.302]|nr:ABC transporter substrate-binding protein [Leptolyngbyaceae cyanobacterium bins.302]